MLLVLVGCGGNSFRLADLWLTPDQQGRRAFEQGNYVEAAQHFEDPMWKGTALYLAQRFEASLGEFTRVNTAEGWFNRGNTLAHLERYEEAVACYRKAMEMRADYPEAAANLKYLEPFLPLEFEGGEMGTVGRDAEPDEIRFDADADRLDEEGIDTTVEGETGLLSDEELSEIWLRQVDTSPASFLRHKFAYQVLVNEEKEEGP